MKAANFSPLIFGAVLALLALLGAPTWAMVPELSAYVTPEGVAGLMLANGIVGQTMNQNFPSLADFKAYMVNDLGKVEVIKQSLYDTVLYPTAGQAQLLFFQNPIGQGLSASPGNATLPKALTDTNMQLPGQLPAPQAFWVQSIELDFQPGSSAAASTFALQIPAFLTATGVVTSQAGAHDVNAFYTGGALTFTVGTKPYLQEAPLLRFPPKARFELDSSIALGAGAAATLERAQGKEKLKAGGRPYQLEPGIPLMTSQNFNITLSWPAAIVTPSGFNGAVRCILDGWLFRAVQ